MSVEWSNPVSRHDGGGGLRAVESFTGLRVVVLEGAGRRTRRSSARWRSPRTAGSDDHVEAHVDRTRRTGFALGSPLDRYLRGELL